MTAHDPLCPLSDQSTLVMGADCPRCDEYARIRADERERCKEGPWASEWAALALEVEAEVRERIAQEIEDRCGARPCTDCRSLADSIRRGEQP